MQKTWIRQKPDVKREGRKKRVTYFCVFLIALYLSCFIWGGRHPNWAASVQVVSAAWLISIGWQNGWLKIDDE